MKPAQHTHTSKKGDGTIRTIVDRRTRKIIGYRALLPESMSAKRGPAGKRYRQPVGDVKPTWDAARRFLDVVIQKHLSAEAVQHGLRLIDYLESEIEERRLDCMRAKMTEAQTTKRLAQWRAYRTHWVEPEAFAAWPPRDVDRETLQAYVGRLKLAISQKTGAPLANNTIHNIVDMLRCIFKRAKVAVDPTRGLEMPERAEPKIPHLDLRKQKLLLGCKAIPMRDRIMIGCGMGAGLRVNELLSMERDDIDVDSDGPHLMVRYGGKDRASTKAGLERRVELFEPGLGFWRLWLAEYAPVDGLVFQGPQGGYPTHWPDQFQQWATLAGLDRLTSHYMRHSYAVSMLSGLWGYAPRTLEFVQHQLGHSEIQTTEKYYGKFAVGTWAREVALMTGKIASREIRSPLNAGDLMDGASNGARSSKSPRKVGVSLVDGQHAKVEKTRKKAPKNALNGASAHHCTGVTLPPVSKVGRKVRA